MPELSEETEELLACFRLCETQLSTNMNGAYAMDWGVVTIVASSMNIPINEFFFNALRQYEIVLITEMNSK